MLVAQILKGKPSQKVITVPGDCKVSDAATILSSNRIGALVVSKSGSDVVGIFSERDIVRELGKRGVTCLNDCVSDIMTTKIVTCTGADKSGAILQKMNDGKFRHLPVVEENKLVGMISIGDVVHARLAEVEMENKALEGMIKGY